MKSVKQQTMEQKQQWRKLSGERIKIPIEDELSNVLKHERDAGYEMKVCRALVRSVILFGKN